MDSLRISLGFIFLFLLLEHTILKANTDEVGNTRRQNSGKRNNHKHYHVAVGDRLYDTEIHRLQEACNRGGDLLKIRKPYGREFTLKHTAHRRTDYKSAKHRNDAKQKIQRIGNQTDQKKLKRLQLDLARFNADAILLTVLVANRSDHEEIKQRTEDRNCGENPRRRHPLRRRGRNKAENIRRQLKHEQADDRIRMFFKKLFHFVVLFQNY